MAWDCKDETIEIGETISHEINIDYGITVILQDVSPSGIHKALVGVYFYWAQPPDELVVISPGSYESYTDPKGVEWRVHVDSTKFAGVNSTAKVRICYEAAAPAEGQIMSIDVPAEANEGDSIDLCATIKNVGGTTAKFFLRFYDGTTMVKETLPGTVAAGQTIENICELFAMPGHAWNGKIDLIRQG